MVIINEQKCIGCGLCVFDCLPQNLTMVDKKAKTINEKCMQCGHCVAICPNGAVSIDDYDMEDVCDVQKNNITSDELLNFIKTRRSIRHFKEEKISHLEIEKIIEAGRYSPTSTNMQDLKYIVVEDKLEDFRKLTLEELDIKADELLANSDKLNPTLKFYANMWKNIVNSYKANPSKKDNLFLNAKTIILITASSELNVGIATSNMELMANSLNIGMLYSGFIQNTVKDNVKINRFLNIPDDAKIMACLVLGYPDVQYKRSAPRKSADINWQ